jgi:hypothetical protein
VGVPTDVRGIDPDQAIHQAQREAADTALGKVRLQHCGTECHVTTAAGHWGAKLKADRFEDLFM